MSKRRILFVCTGNICRSPTAHGVMLHLVRVAGLSQRVEVDSCGVSGYHVGDRPDPRSQDAAKKRGYDLSKLKARKLNEKDFAAFDYVVAMDTGHLQHMKERCDETHWHKLSLLLHFEPALGKDDVVDPYYGPANGFERVLDDIEAGCKGLLAHIYRELNGS